MGALHPDQFGEKSIRTKSMPNVETERLSGRLEGLRKNLTGVSSYDGRAQFGDRVREAINIERELTRRGTEFKPVTNGEHLKVDVNRVPVMGPRPSKKERNGG